MTRSPRRPTPRVTAAMILALALSAGLLTGLALAADAARGARLASDRRCSGCHESVRSTPGRLAAPTFVSIAKTPGFSVDRVARFLMDGHRGIPAKPLTRDQAEDIAAYIASFSR
jgi:mono/diheme cytochrome c family protein